MSRRTDDKLRPMMAALESTEQTVVNNTRDQYATSFCTQVTAHFTIQEKAASSADTLWAFPQVENHQFIKQKDQSATYIDMHEIHVGLEIV